MPRDKVGLVGRNGAGKTSLFRVLGGEAEPAAGRVVRKGAFGYLPQDPRIAGVLDGRTAVAHVLSGRGVDAEMERIEKLRIAMEERPDERNVARYTRAEELFRTNGGYAADSEARALAAGLGIGPDRIEHPIGVLSGGERRRVELARILFAGSDVLCLDEPTNHLDVDAKEWLMGFLRAYRGALLVISHDLDLLDEAITRVLHLDRPDEAGTGHLVEYRGTYSQYVARAGRRRGAPGAAWPCARRRRSPACSASSTASAPRRSKASLAHSMEKRIARLEADKVDAPRGDKSLRVRFPQPPTPGRTVIEVVGLAKSYAGPPVFTDVVVRSRPRRAAARARPQRRRQDEPAAHPRRRDRGRPRHVRLRPQRDDRLLRPGARQPARRRVAARQHPPRGAARHRAHRDPAARPARHVRAVGREGVPGRRHAVGRREDEAGAGDADGRAQQPAAARRADEQPRSRRAAGPSPTRSATGRAR